MKGFSLFAAIVAVVVCLLTSDCYAQRNQCNVQSSNNVSSAAAIQNQAVIDRLVQQQSQVATTPRVSTATASSGSVAERRALSAPAVVSASPGASSVATSSSVQAPPRRGIRGIVDRNRASSVAITRRNGRTVAIAR